METLRQLLILPFLLGPALGAESWHRVVNAMEGYSVELPGTWTIWNDQPNGSLSATTYSKAFEGGLVPRGEAAIDIAPAGHGIGTEVQWANRDSRGVQELTRKHTAASGGSKGPRSYLHVETRDEVGPGVYYRTIAYYFSMANRIFRARVEFAESDPLEQKYRATFDRVVRSTTAEPLRKR